MWSALLEGRRSKQAVAEKQHLRLKITGVLKFAGAPNLEYGLQIIENWAFSAGVQALRDLAGGLLLSGMEGRLIE